MHNGTNAPCKPEFEGQIVKFRSPHNHKAILFDLAVRNPKYGYLEWQAMNNPTEAEKQQAFWAGEKA